MKAAPIVSAIREYNERVSVCPSPDGNQTAPEPIHHVLVHTGQHYDQLMSDSFFTDLNLPQPDVHLGVGSGSHAVQTAEIMRRFEEVLLEVRPDVVVVVGDVNSTMACALVAAKISFDASGTRPLIAHVEAGLRSFDRSMPEEVNRILTDQVSDLLFVTEKSGLRNLAHEGVPEERVRFVGNTMIDSLLACRQKAEASTILGDLGLRNGAVRNGSGDSAAPYVLLTLHRPANVDRREAFLNILQGLEEVVEECPVVFPAHPRTQQRVTEFGLDHYFEGNPKRDDPTGATAGEERSAIRMIAPLGYLDFLYLMNNAALVVTDSGGIQEETTCLGIPCVTVRENTERPVTLEVGTNVLAGVSKQGIRDAIRRQLGLGAVGTVPELWDGKSSVRILEVVAQELRKRRTVPSRASSPHGAQTGYTFAQI